MRSHVRLLALLSALALSTPLSTRAGDPQADSPAEFFESRIRPVLVEQCYRCHNSAKRADGGLAVDTKAALIEGGDNGAIVVPGKPGESRLLNILRHEDATLKMPKGGAKLEGSVIADFETWIATGAYDPREQPPTAEELKRESSWEVIRDRRKQWWSLQPVRRPELPPLKDGSWSDHPIDRFVAAKMEEHGLRPSPRADRRTLLRRASFVLTGLPPTPSEIRSFLEDKSPDAYEKQVDRLLASPRFGERWARHWMDLVRYCESHGSQGDPELPNAWRYRDYLIRAFNSDIPYDQFLREQIAGDLLPNPRINAEENLNESAIGPAHLRMGEFGFVPVDALEDQVKVVDNQIDVISKSMLGLTVSCARCHDHKFDAISQKDYYALYGVFASCRPGQVEVDRPEVLSKNREELDRLKARIRAGLADAWRDAIPAMLSELKQSGLVESQRRSLLAQEHELRSRIEEIERPVRESVQKIRGQFAGVALPTPMARWSFNDDVRDSIGTLHGNLAGDATFRNGRLILNGKNVEVRTPPLGRDLGQKTLEAWVSLANLEQRGVGVITVESDEGATFDSIVFGEIAPKFWLAGSDLFNRTINPNGPAETAEPGKLIHMAIVYRRDNSITLYRDGMPYGTAYTKGSLRTFSGSKARMMFGRRHPGQGIAYLEGEIDEARLYDRPLTAEEVAASYKAGPSGVSRDEIVKTLTPDMAKQLISLHDERSALRIKIEAAVPSKKWSLGLADAIKNPTNPLHAWTQLSSLSGNSLSDAWSKLASETEKKIEQRRESNSKTFKTAWDLSGDDASRWFASGTGLTGKASRGGQFGVEITGDRVVRGIFPAGMFTHGLSRKHSGVLSSPRFVITTDTISIRALGEQSTARIVIENYPIGNGGIYPSTRLNRDEMGWIKLDTSYRKGSHAYIEFLTDDNERAYFGAGQVALHDGPNPPQEVVVPSRFLMQGSTPSASDSLIDVYADRLRSAIVSFRSNTMADDEVAFLDYFVRNELLPVSVGDLTKLRELIEEYRQKEREIPMPRRAPGMHEAVPFDQPLFVRGQHTQPSDPVPRRFLEVLDGDAYPGPTSGRLHLADEIASRSNPLTARVMVNRLWQDVFGKGIVGTVDNFGRMGDKPTHPELLDYLASRFMDDEKWSIKQTLRVLVTSQTFQQGSATPESVKEIDGPNDWLSHARIRRLDAESIRDSILATSGQLDPKMYGRGVNVYFVNKTEGGGPKGPLDGDRRRSIYQSIRRNAQNPFLEVFDAPKPTTTRGKRDVTNVPAQSLTMLNDPFVIEQSAKWAVTLTREVPARDDRIRHMFETALGREPDRPEMDASIAYLAELAAENGVAIADLIGNAAVWQDFAHSIFCLKEFIYVH